MNIKDAFKNDLSRRIKEVIKVDDPDLGTVAEEIEDYWVTDHIEEQLTEILDVYEDTILKPSEEVNVWVSGFFGSGKSSFAKILGHVLANPVLGETTAADLLTQKLGKDKVRALLRKIHEQAPTLSIFVDLSSGTSVLREGESAVLPLYRELLSDLGYSREPRLAELEFDLEGDGDLEQFERLFEQANDGKLWKERRDRALAANEASAAMHLLRPSIYNLADSWARGGQQHPELTANSFAKRALEVLHRRRPDCKRITLIVDEAGQYVATDIDRMRQLQGLAQACQKEDGRLWLVATSQMALEEVVSALGGKRSELARAKDRFPIEVDLATSDIGEVVSHRVLAKNQLGKNALKLLYDANKNQLLANTTLESSALGREFTSDEFVQFYPLLPYQIELFIRAVSAHRAKGGAGPMFGGTNRTLIRLAQQLIINQQTDLGSKPIGDLATSAMAYDLLDGIIPDAWRFEVDQVGQHRGKDSLEHSIAKSVALLSEVPLVQLRRRNLAILLHPGVEHESLEPRVADALSSLESDELLGEDDDGFRLQSPDEKDWEKRRRSLGLNTGSFRRILRERLADILNGATASAAREFKLAVYFDEDRISEGEIAVRILEGGADQVDRAVRLSRESAFETDLFVIFERSEKSWRIAEELHRSREMVRESEGRSRTGEESNLLLEERKRMERLQLELDRSTREDILGCKVVFQGVEGSLAGQDARSAIASAAAARVENIYPQLALFAVPVKRTYALSVLREDDLSGLPDSLGEDGLGVIRATSGGYEIAKDNGALAAFLQEVIKRRNFGQEASGRYLEGHFGAPPYGGDVDVVMILAASAIRAGEIEVTSDGSRLRTFTDPRLDKVFGSLPKFRSAVFLPRNNGVDPALKTGVAQLLDELTGERTSIVTEQLASAITVKLAADRDRVGRLSAVLQGAGLKVPDSIAAAHRTLSRSVSEQDEERIASVYAARNDIKDGVLEARRLDDLLSEGDRLELLRRAARITAISEGELSVDSRGRQTKVKEVLQSGDYVNGFPELRSAVEGVDEERRELWHEAERALEVAMTAAIRDVDVVLRDLPQEARDDARRGLDQYSPASGWSFEAGPSIDRLRSMAEGLPAEVDRIRREIAQSAGITVVQMRAGQLYPHTVKDETGVDGLLETIRAAAEATLADGKHFQLS